MSGILVKVGEISGKKSCHGLLTVGDSVVLFFFSFFLSFFLILHGAPAMSLT